LYPADFSRLKLITLCGVDGSGKTTQIRLLCKSLNGMGFKTKYVWFRWPILFSYPFLLVCRLLGYTKPRVIKKINFHYNERRFYLNNALAKLWTWFFAIDAVLQSFVRIFIPLGQGYLVLCDRYVPDILVDLICETKDTLLLRKLPGRLLLSAIPKNTCFLLIDVDEKTAFERKQDIPSLDYLKERRALYLKLAVSLKIPVIDGKKNPQDMHQEIINGLQ
jgi:thymidylate kinase